MFLKAGWEQSLARWRAFWEGRVEDRPPVLIHRMAAFASDISGSREVGPNTVLARNLAFYDPAQNEALLEQMEKGLEARAEMPDDMAPSVVAGGGVHFAGATFGAPVQVTASMLTSEPIIHDWSQARGHSLRPGQRVGAARARAGAAVGGAWRRALRRDRGPAGGA